MYIPKRFKISDKDEIFSFINNHSFGQLISNVDGRPFSSHIPFLLSADKSTIFAHIALQNPQHKSIEDQDVLITLDGPHGYISPSWYHSVGVPTWNYQTVHIYGTCKIFSDANKLKTVVDLLTAKHEATFAQPWLPDYNASMLSAIVGIEIHITDIQCQYKLSQNKSVLDQESVINNLSKHGLSDLAQSMDKLKL